MISTRRQMLKGIATLATIQSVPSRVLGLNSQTSLSNEITKSILGCGGISASHPFLNTLPRR